MLINEDRPQDEIIDDLEVVDATFLFVLLLLFFFSKVWMSHCMILRNNRLVVLLAALITHDQPLIVIFIFIRFI